MANYNGQQKDWPHFKFSLTGVEGELLTFSEKVGRGSDILEVLPEKTKRDLIVDIIVPAEQGSLSLQLNRYLQSFIG